MDRESLYWTMLVVGVLRSACRESAAYARPMEMKQTNVSCHVTPAGAVYWALLVGGRAGRQHVSHRGRLPDGSVGDSATPALVLALVLPEIIRVSGQ